MEDPVADAILNQYFRRLEQALSLLPAERREQIVEDLRAHIEDALRSEPDRSEVAVLAVLDRVGDPDEIAQEALGGRHGRGRSRYPGPPARGPRHSERELRSDRAACSGAQAAPPGAGGAGARRACGGDSSPGWRVLHGRTEQNDHGPRWCSGRQERVVAVGGCERWRWG